MKNTHSKKGVTPLKENKQELKKEHQRLILKEWDTLNDAEKDRVLYLDEKLCIKGSLAHDRKLSKERDKQNKQAYKK